MVTLTPVRGRAQFQRWPFEKGFNSAAAESVYKALMALDDDEALIAGRMMAGAALQHTLMSKRAQITGALDDAVGHRAEVMREHLARTAVAKSRAGDDSLPELQALAELVKAFNISDTQRREYARRERRDMATGRFAESHVKIGYDSDVKALPKQHAAQFGIPESNRNLSAADRARFQQAYLQIRDLVAPYSRMPAGDALLHVTIETKDGPRPLLLSPGDIDQLKTHVKKDEHISSASVSVVPTVGLGGAAYDALAAVGAPRAGATVAGMTDGGLLDPDRLQAFDEQLQTRYAQDDYVPSHRVFRNLESGSRLLTDSLGNAAPPKVQMALAVGEQVGRLGPEAQKVIGPTADKAAYRYRGTEREVTPQLSNAIESLQRSPSVSAADKREVMLHGREAPDGSGWQPSGVLLAIKRWLPDPGRSELQLKAGKVPPSRGVIFDASGKRPAKEFVGFGDDWYLPFNLKNLKNLRGGEYIRTRTYGGPTTEDIYTGLVGGAKAMTVVSHNGVYTIDFNPELKGGRRFNDKAAAMVGRYGHLLDAVRSRQVQTGGIASSRMAELEAEAGAIYDEDEEPVEFRNELGRRIAGERKRPKLSRDQELDANLEFFNNLAASRGDGSAQVLNPDDLVTEFAAQLGNQRYAAAATAARAAGQGDQFRADPAMAPERFKAQAIAELQRDDTLEQARVIAQALNVDGQRTRFLEQARKTNAQAVKTLQLNGEGYKIALDALQEQFPYYIDRVEFHPWNASTQASEDTGYVRPNRARPAEALAGFFDPLSSRSGKSKVYADSTRYQNRSTQLRDYFSERRREPESAPSSRSTQAPARDDEALRAKADQALYEEIRAQSAFGDSPAGMNPDMLSGWTPQALAREHTAELEAMAPDLTSFLLMSPEDFAQARTADPAGVTAALGRAREQARDTGLLDLSTAVTEAHAGGGRRELGEHPSLLLGRGEAELAVPGAAYSASARPDAAQVQAAYQSDRAIAPLIGAGLLPNSLSDATFEAKSGELERTLLEQRNQLQAQVSNDMIATPQHWRPIDRPAEGLLRARQLKRRHGEAAQRGVTRPQQAGGQETQVENHVNMAPRQEWESPEDYARTQAALMDEIQRRRKQEFDEMRTIAP